MTGQVQISPSDFMSAAAPPALSGNTPWAGRYAPVIREVVRKHSSQAPRSLQRHLGPSEIGHVCHRQVVGKLAEVEPTNHVGDPWPSVVGTAVHAWLADAFSADNIRTGLMRWIPEHRVTPIDGHPGTADLYDAAERAVVDHKVQGESTASKVRGPSGPPRHYVVQLLLYGRGYRRLGLPVDRVVLVSYPRTGSSLDALYVWERPYTDADDHLIDNVVVPELEYRRRWAVAVATGRASLNDVPAVPEDCQWCPFYRPQAARDGGAGCPGHAPGGPTIPGSPRPGR